MKKKNGKKTEKKNFSFFFSFFSIFFFIFLYMDVAFIIFGPKYSFRFAWRLKMCACITKCGQKIKQIKIGDFGALGIVWKSELDLEKKIFNTHIYT